jgi:hypothetical protein
MRLKTLTIVLLAALALPAATLASPAACCDRAAEKCPMPCCTHDQPVNGVELLLELSGGVSTGEEMFPRETRQRAVVWFHRPVWVGRYVLMGKYIIEHDTGRQARGEPCTHIYAADNPNTPVVAFHCTHLDADTSERNVVALQSFGDRVQKLVWFQFAGEASAHSYPTR